MRTSTEFAPVVEIRLKTKECFAIELGMKVLQDDAREVHLDRWSPELNTHIDGLARHIASFSERHGSKSHRIHLDSIDIAATMFAVRRLRKELKRGLCPFPAAPEPILLNRLLRKLEKYRKRGERAWVNRSRSGYEQWHRIWGEFVARVRNNQRVPHPASYVRENVEKYLKVTKQALEEAKFTDSPDDKTLLSIVRTMRRDVRRGRGKAGTRDFMEQNERARRWALTYVEQQTIQLRKALIAQARTNPDCPLARSVAHSDDMFGDDEDLKGVDWIWIAASHMSLAELQRACHVEQSQN